MKHARACIVRIRLGQDTGSYGDTCFCIGASCPKPAWFFAGRVNIVVPRPSRVYAGDKLALQLQSGVDPGHLDV